MTTKKLHHTNRTTSTAAPAATTVAAMANDAAFKMIDDAMNVRRNFAADVMKYVVENYPPKRKHVVYYAGDGSDPCAIEEQLDYLVDAGVLRQVNIDGYNTIFLPIQPASAVIDLIEGYAAIVADEEGWFTVPDLFKAGFQHRGWNRSTTTLLLRQIANDTGVVEWNGMSKKFSRFRFTNRNV